MAFTTSDLAVIDAAIASGTLRVRFADREITYRSTTELLEARNAIQESLNPPVTRQHRVRFDPGF